MDKEIEDITFALILVYYNRPNMVCNALESIRDQDYDNFYLTFIDDGSAEIPGGTAGAPIAKRILKDKIGEYRHTFTYPGDYVEEVYDKASFIYIFDTPDKKIEQKGSRHPHFMNEAVLRLPREEDVAVVVCDDDLLNLFYLKDLHKFYKENPDLDSSYCHVIPFDPFTEDAHPNMVERANGFWLNHGTMVMRYCRVDSTQVTYRKRCFSVYGCRYHSPWERASDADLFAQLDAITGACMFNGLIGQFKCCSPKQLSYRISVEDIYYNVIDTETKFDKT